MQQNVPVNLPTFELQQKNCVDVVMTSAPHCWSVRCLKTNISHGSLVTSLVRSFQITYCKFTIECSTEEILKIGQLAKIWTKVCMDVSTHTMYFIAV